MSRRERHVAAGHAVPEEPHGWFLVNVRFDMGDPTFAHVVVLMEAWYNQDSVDGWYVGKAGSTEAMTDMFPNGVVDEVAEPWGLKRRR